MFDYRRPDDEEKARQVLAALARRLEALADAGEGRDDGVKAAALDGASGHGFSKEVSDVRTVFVVPRDGNSARSC